MSNSIHEIISTVRQLDEACNIALKNMKAIFGKKSLFSGKNISLEHFNPEEAHLNVSEEQNLDTTVKGQLDNLRTAWTRWVNAEASKNQGNSEARADVVVDGGYGDNHASTVIDLTTDEPEVLREGKGSLDIL